MQHQIFSPKLLLKEIQMSLKKHFKKWRSIAIFGHFAKAIVRQNGYKMVDFGNEVLVNQVDD